MTSPATTSWPSLRVSDWTPTRDTLHMWTQIVGKIRTAHAPLLNHWWQVTLYVSARGLTTSTIPHRTRAFEIEFDFLGHQLDVRSSDGGRQSLALRPMPVAEFYTRILDMLARLGIEAPIRPHPNEVDPAIPFAEEGYSRELSSCGFWPGGGDEGAFYSYAYPEPGGFADQTIGPDGAYSSTGFQ